MKPAVASHGLVVCVVCALLSLAARSVGAATDVVPEFRITAETNDNPRLRAENDPLTPQRSASRLVADVRVSLTSFTPRAEVAFEPAVRTDAYDNVDDELESTDWYLRGRGRWRWQRARLGFGADYSRERILGTEFLARDPGDLNEIVEADGVLLGLNEVRTRVTFSPYTEIDAGERARVRLDLRAMDVSYDDEALLDARTDFTNWEAGAAYVRILSSRAELSTRVFGGQYEAEDARNVTDTVGLEMRLERELSNVWAVAGAVGVERSDYGYVDDAGLFFAGTEDSVVLDLELRKRSERTLFAIDLGRRVQPDSFGSVVIRDELAASLRRDLSVKLNGGVVVRAIRSDGLGAIPSNREYGRVELLLGWSFKPLWSLLAAYERSYWRNATGDATANSNSVVVGFAYRGRSRREQP